MNFCPGSPGDSWNNDRRIFRKGIKNLLDESIFYPSAAPGKNIRDPDQPEKPRNARPVFISSGIFVTPR